MVDGVSRLGILYGMLDGSTHCLLWHGVTELGDTTIIIRNSNTGMDLDDSHFVGEVTELAGLLTTWEVEYAELFF